MNCKRAPWLYDGSLVSFLNMRIYNLLDATGYCRGEGDTDHRLRLASWICSGQTTGRLGSIYMRSAIGQLDGLASEPSAASSFLPLFQGFTVFAGFSNKAENEELMQKLKDDASGRLHVLQLDVTSERDIHSTFLYVNENLPDGAPGTSL